MSGNNNSRVPWSGPSSGKPHRSRREAPPNPPIQNPRSISSNQLFPTNFTYPPHLQQGPPHLPRRSFSTSSNGHQSGVTGPSSGSNWGINRLARFPELADLAGGGGRSRSSSASRRGDHNESSSNRGPPLRTRQQQGQGPGLLHSNRSPLPPPAMNRPSPTSKMKVSGRNFEFEQDHYLRRSSYPNNITSGGIVPPHPYSTWRQQQQQHHYRPPDFDKNSSCPTPTVSPSSTTSAEESRGRGRGGGGGFGGVLGGGGGAGEEILAMMAADMDYNVSLRGIREWQKDFIRTLGLTELELSRSETMGGLGESSKTCPPFKMHTFLLNAIQNIKEENTEMAAELLSLRSKIDQEAVRAEGLAKELDTSESERRRAMKGFKDTSKSLHNISKEVKCLRSFVNEDIAKQTEARIRSLQTENDDLRSTLTDLQAASGGEITRLTTDLQSKVDRYERLRIASETEKKEVEQRWQKMWEAQTERLKSEYDVLKENYERPLTQSHKREAALQEEINTLRNQNREQKESWERYRLSLFEQLEKWKDQYVAKCGTLEELQMKASQMEELLEEKGTDLKNAHEMLSEGIKERQTLQKRVDALQLKLRDFVGLRTAAPDPSESPRSSLTRPPAIKRGPTLKASKSLFSVMQNKQGEGGEGLLLSGEDGDDEDEEEDDQDDEEDDDEDGDDQGSGGRRNTTKQRQRGWEPTNANQKLVSRSQSHI